MSIRNYMTNDELVQDAVYNRRREAELCERLMHLDGWEAANVARACNACGMRAQASEDVLVTRIERVLRRQSGPYAPRL